ncbi:MAG: hypothetical protein A3F84_15705 [Candidatus Handelsmanbacteria bacterium RIFCSPLOWO2_12_FULL_64_10]|uniref:Coenzyme Q-binding protein COQ10 START domain-containing protein n=1 Tax=Handelsmanbacteria sp. (strain RIFCSPLOWO2_12_FULL_64_10) TaxID=1817868 RepID=A0A1F6D679_HANXR|nr:MAG: hypothetical protein A3F84_15705 [Candidatus Handelsmanbacteria bacterium RIFCSPLOWO2_12_FULL_64_10]
MVTAALCLALAEGCGGDITGLAADGSLTAARLDSLMALPTGVYVEARTTIQAPPESVWTVFSDFNRWRAWDPSVLRTQTTEGDALEWGLHFTQTYATRPVEVTVRNVIVRLVPGREVVWKGAVFGLHILRATAFQRTEDGQTEVVSRERMAGPLAYLFRDRLQAEAQRAAQRALNGLRAFCEAHRPAVPPPAPSQAPDTTVADTMVVKDTTAVTNDEW